MSRRSKRAGESDAERESDVEIDTRVRARELRFESKPEVRVAVYSDSPAQGGTESRRSGIPDDVQTGVTYRDVAVRWRARARLKDEEDDRPDEPRLPQGS
jgi:hypothetical protein